MLKSREGVRSSFRLSSKRDKIENATVPKVAAQVRAIGMPSVIVRQSRQAARAFALTISRRYEIIVLEDLWTSSLSERE